MKIAEGLGAINQGQGGGGFPGMGGGGGGDKGGSTPSAEEAEKGGFYEFQGYDLSIICDWAWYMFLLSLVPIVVMMIYSALVVYGALQAQNLESRGWGIASSILVMLPMNIGGFALVLALLVQFGMNIVIDDTEFIGNVGLGIIVILWLVCIALGAMALTTLLKEEVIEGFEYVAE
jgi:hypothetical protein